MPAYPESWFRSFIIVALCVGLLGGCSALRIGYSQAPDLLYWYLDGYVDFNSGQTPRVREALAQWAAWHRRTQLPDYANQLARAQTEVLADTSAVRVCEWQTELVQRAGTAFESAVPAAADFLLTVTPEQVQHLERRQLKANEEFRDAYLQRDPRKRTDETLRRTVERAETLYGKLTDAQRGRIAESLARSPFDPEAWFAERRLRQQEAVSLMRRLGAGESDARDSGARESGARESGAREPPGREQAQAALRLYAQRVASSPREAYRRYAERLNEFNCGFAAALHNGTSALQRKAAAQKLAGWEGDARALALDAPRSASLGTMLR